ncbi:MAG: L-glutamate gamma-semialdehyde dehydrogenase [Bacteroidota bacterium]
MTVPRFRNEAPTDFGVRALRKKQEEALSRVRSSAGKEYPIVIGGNRLKGSATFASTNPSHPAEVLGIFQKGDAEIARKAVETARSAFEEWRRVPYQKRAEYLFKAARVMRRRRFEMNATMILEVGKSWPEADGDTAEAVDFLEFYAREMLRYGKDQPVVRIPGERGCLRYLPLGVCVIIPPWNFPLAILTGMTTAAIVTGNTVVLKPSSDSPLTGWRLMEIMEEVGLPEGVLNVVTGPGGAVGDTLVGHPSTRCVAFTGSKEVGMHINELAARVQPGQIWLKRVVAEMGGKDSIIVDAGVDQEEAAAGVIASAFGFQGQKCSACSRAIVHERIYDRFVDLLARKAEALVVGDPARHGTFMGPVVNASACEQILAYIRKGVAEGGRLVAGGGRTDEEGFFIRPTVIADVHPRATIAQEEIFGPVLAVLKAADFEEALAIANNTEYGLTGAVYSNARSRLQKAEREFFVGNLYLNRKCTGALVGVHPFGGFNMSGTDSKAGGRDYLLLFLQAQSIAERLRH